MFSRFRYECSYLPRLRTAAFSGGFAADEASAALGGARAECAVLSESLAAAKASAFTKRFREFTASKKGAPA